MPVWCKRHWPCVPLLGASAIICWGFLNDRLILSHDAGAGLLRQIALYRSLGDGQFFVRWVADLNFGYGYPLFNFYPPFFYYLTQLWIFAGLPVVPAINFSCIVVVTLSGITMYLFAREFAKPHAALVAALAYLFAPYHIGDLYVRGAYAELSAFLWLPLILWCMYRLFRRGAPVYAAAGALAVGLMVLTHTITAMLFLPVVVAYIVFLFFTDRQRSARMLGMGLLSLGTGIALAAFFWMPALIESGFVHVASLRQGKWAYGNHFVYPGQLVYSPWGFGESVPGTGDGMSFQIGIAHLALALIALVAVWWRRRQKTELRQQLIFFAVLFIVAAIFTTPLSLPVWKHIPLLQFAQFPWRFLVLVSCAVSFLAAGVSLLPLPRMPLMMAIAAAGVVLASLFYCKPPSDKPLWASESLNVDDIRDLLNYMPLPDIQEYLPVWVRSMPPKPSVEKLTSEEQGGVLSSQRRSAVEYLFQVNAPADTLLSFNTFYFPGWRVYVDGMPVAINPDNEHGLVQFRVAAGTHRVRVKFGATPVRLAGNIISLVAALLIIGGGFWSCKGINKSGSPCKSDG